MPQVSVIVPVYKVEKYIHRCVDSILAQTFTDFELILVDDGSPDNCGAICDEYAEKDSRVKVIHKKNGGVSAARNSALDIATGEFITFCDSDDWWDQDFLEKMISAIMDCDADSVSSNYRFINEDGSEKEEIKYEEKKYSRLSAEENIRFCVFDILCGKVGWAIWKMIFRADIIQDNKIRFCTTCGNYAEDLGFVLVYSFYSSKHCSICYCGYNYFLRSNSMMQSGAGKVKLNELNEVSAFVGEQFERRYGLFRRVEWYPLMHFLMMYTEYHKLIGKSEYANLRCYVSGISNVGWFQKQTRGIFKCYRMLCSVFGRNRARQMLLLSHYCLHLNWNRFCYESALAYKFFIRS